MEMKTLLTRPYLQNIVAEYHRQKGSLDYKNDYPAWLCQFGFQVPIMNDHLEFPDDFPDDELVMFVLRWS
jgi:hypothetical protein